MTAPYKVDMMTESVISHMAARTAALEAENAELKRVTFDPRVLDQMNALESERNTLRQQLETAREALVAARHMIYHEDAPLGWNITRLDEALAAIGEAQPASAEVKPVLDELTDEQRQVLFSHYCTSCGGKELPCYCVRDD